MIHCSPDQSVVGDVLVLTKPLGTQIAVNAHQWLDEVGGCVDVCMYVCMYVCIPLICSSSQNGGARLKMLSLRNKVGW